MKITQDNENSSSSFPFRKALEWILLSTFLISGSCALAVFYYRHVKDSYAKDDRYKIVALVQTCNDNECLKTGYLAELLDLSIDRPSNLYRFKTREARKRLLESPLIKTAEVKKIKPGTIYIDYTLRKPAAYIAELTNTAMDDEGVLIPFKPFFTPKNIPEFVLGLDEETSDPAALKWGTRLQGKKTRIALHMLKLLSENYAKEGTLIRRIDVSKAFAPSYGQREIVVILEDRREKSYNSNSYLYIYPRTIRFSTNRYLQELADFGALRDRLNKMGEPSEAASQSTVWKAPGMLIDMRIPQLAFIGKVE